MCVRHTQQLKVFLPIRTLLGEWGRTETNFDPMYFFVIADPSLSMSWRYSSPAIEPCPNVPESTACSSTFWRPDFTRADQVAHNRIDDTPQLRGCLFRKS